ncbi:MAG: CPBP family intramembrane glutamic endopeptidase [Bacteroidales bacterium]
MQHQDLLQAEYPQATFAILSTLAGFLLYHFLGDWRSKADRSVSDLRDEGLLIRRIFLQKMWGFFSMGLLPLAGFAIMFGFSPDRFGLSADSLLLYWPWLLVSIGAPVFVNYFLANNPSNLRQYPQMRVNRWTTGRFLLNATGWTMYLLAYEFLFRGLLLFSTYEVFGIWTAIAINVTIYSLAHLPKGSGETLGAIPFGIILCLLTLYTGTLFFAFFMHLALALSNDFWAIRYNPEMSFNKE